MRPFLVAETDGNNKADRRCGGDQSLRDSASDVKKRLNNGPEGAFFIWVRGTIDKTATARGQERAKR